MQFDVIGRATRSGLFAAITSLILTGCATYSSSFKVIEGNLAAQQYDQALQALEKQPPSKTDLALYALNKGMILRMKRDFAGSNQALEQAKAEMERLYAASVSENALSFIINDATVSYGGDDFEQVLVHLYMALNYLELGDKDAARVESLQVDLKLREIGEKIAGSKYTEDAFSLYLSGLIYEDEGEWSDALISYRQAYEAYKKYQQDYSLAVPTMLKYDLLRLTKRQGLPQELARYKKEFGLDLSQMPANQAGQGELIFVLSNGLVPIKREKALNSLDPASGTLVRIALPSYESRSNDVVAMRISVGEQQAMSELMENVDGIARASLDSRMPAIMARSIARAVVKAAASKKAQQVARNGNNRNNDSSMVGLLGAVAVQVAAYATERADTRSWLTLPANIQLARLSLPPGSYTVKAELLDSAGVVVNTREYPGVVIGKGHKTYLTQHWIPAQTASR
ncbi:MAG TPA: hypothetical protein VIU93_00230 [Gallionellaceae bacterium]